MGRNDLLDNFRNHLFLDSLVGYVGSMLGGDDNRIDAARLAVNILNRNLGLRVGAEEVELAGLAHFSQLGYQLVGQLDRHRHQFRSLVAGIAEHEPLIAGTLFLMEPLTFRNTLTDVRRLAVNGNKHGTGIGIKTRFRNRYSRYP